jgi:hypothetical protein
MYYRIKKLCINFIIKTSLYYDARSEKHQILQDQFRSNGKPEGKRPLGRPRRRWRIILRGIFRKWEGIVGTGWSGLRIGKFGGHLCIR